MFAVELALELVIVALCGHRRFPDHSKKSQAVLPIIRWIRCDSALVLLVECHELAPMVVVVVIVIVIVVLVIVIVAY